MADYTPADIYDDYQKEVEDPIDRDLMQTLCEEFNQKVMERVIYEGRPFEMGSFLSAIQVVRRKRDPKKKVPNWKASNALKEELLAEGKKLWDEESGEGHKWLVYYTDAYYCRFYWSKWHCRVPNKGAYKFTPTRGAKGNKTMLKEFLREKELNYKTYKEYKVH